MTPRLRLVTALLLVLFLGVVWLYLYHHTQAVDTARHAQVLEMLREAKQIDADWNVDVHKSLAEVHGNYDPLVRSLARLNTIQAELSAQARASHSAKVEKALSPVEDALARKLDAVEVFKSQHALLKNSLRYIPTAYAEIQPTLRRWPALERDVGNLVAGVLKYQILPDEDTALLLRASIGALRKASRAIPAPLGASVANLLSHVDTVLRERRLQATLLAQLAQPEVAQRLDTLTGAFTRRFEQDLGRQASFQQYLVYYSGLALLLVVGAIGVLLLRSATEFRRMARAVDEATQALHQTEIQLIHSEKMAMLGEVVSGIVHEINTPLGYLRSGLESGRENLNSMLRPHAEQTQRLLELLGQASPDPAALREQVARVDGLQGRLRRSEVLEETSTLLSDGIDGVQQINETVVNLLNFSRLGHSRVVRCRVEGGLESTLKLASHFLKTRQVVRRWSETREIECDL
jgi:two-component system NtrC family sensor kinase